MHKERVHRLSKSRFCSGLQCMKRLWLETHEPDAPELRPSPELQSLFDRGHRVGEVARRQFASGVLIEGGPPDIERRLLETRVAVASGARTVFEAAFVQDGVFVAVDALERNVDGFTLVEVKSTYRVKSPHLPDVGIQMYVARGAGVRVTRAEVMHLVPRSGGCEAFTRSDVTAEAESWASRIPQLLTDMRTALAGPLPRVRFGVHCDEPYSCPFQLRCRGGPASP